MEVRRCARGGGFIKFISLAKSQLFFYYSYRNSHIRFFNHFLQFNSFKLMIAMTTNLVCGIKDNYPVDEFSSTFIKLDAIANKDIIAHMWAHERSGACVYMK